MNHIVKVTERGMKQLQAAVKNGCGRKTGNAFGNEVMEKIHKQDFYSFEGCDFRNLDTYKKFFNHEKTCK